MKWFRKSAALSNASAMTNLGVVFETGLGGEVKNDNDAINWYRKAADVGDTRSMWRLGLMLDAGRGTARDHYQAVALINRSIAAGNNEAKAALDQVNQAWVKEHTYRFWQF